MEIGIGLILSISVILNIYLIVTRIKQEKTVSILEEKEEKTEESNVKLSSSTVKEIMTPRTSIYALDKDQTLEENIDEIIEQGFSRIPVYKESIDDIRGILYLKDIINVDNKQKIEKYMRKAMYVPETMNISKLFEDFRIKQNHMAKEFVGDIRDEYDVEADSIVKISDNIYDVLGETTVDEIDEEINISIPLSEEYETISGFVQYKLGQVAKENDQVTLDKYIIKVMSVENKRIVKVRIILLDEEGEKDD